MERNEGLERQLQARVDQMHREQLQDPAIHLDPDPVANAEPTNQTPPDFGKGT